MLWLIEKCFCSANKNIDKRTYDNIQKIAAGQVDDYTTGCLLDYVYFKIFYKTIAIELSKQHELHADPKANQQMNVTANLDREENATIFFITEKRKENILDFSQGTVRVSGSIQMGKYKNSLNWKKIWPKNSLRFTRFHCLLMPL